MKIEKKSAKNWKDNKRMLTFLAVGIFVSFFYFGNVNVARASDCSDCMAAMDDDSDPDECNMYCSADEGGTSECESEDESSYCCEEFGGNWSSSNFSCNTSSIGNCQTENDSRDCCEDFGGTWTNNSCNTSSIGNCQTENDSRDCCEDFGGYWTGSSCNTSSLGNCETNDDSRDCCEDAGGNWTGNSCDTSELSDCSDYPGTHAVDGECVNDIDTFAGCVENGGTEAYCTEHFDSGGDGFCEGGHCYNNDADYCRQNPDDNACEGTGTPCDIDSDCASVGTDLVCNAIGNTCGKSIWSTVVNAATGLSSQVRINGVSLGMHNGKLTVGTSISVGNTVVPVGSTVVGNNVVGPNGQIIPGITAAMLTTAAGSGYEPPSGNGGAPTGGANCQAGFEKIGGVCFPSKATTGLSDKPIYMILMNLFSWLSGIFVTLAIGAFVVSGIQYLTAAGNDTQIKLAKNNAVNSIMGILVGLSGYVIIKAIAAMLSGGSVLF